MILFIKKMLTANSGVSSKRFCGVLGYLIVAGVLVYCTITQTQAPNMMDIFIMSIMGLLSVDSVTNVFKNKD